MKKLLGILLALALLLGCTAAFADPITLTYAEVNPVPARRSWKSFPPVKSLLISRAAAFWAAKKTSWPTSWAATLPLTSSVSPLSH